MNMPDNLLPETVFKYFYEICSIPHGSGNVKQISDYCVNFSKRYGLQYRQDKYYNVIIKKPASQGYDSHTPVMLQGHLDMVCEKESGYNIDFERDGLRLRTDGQYVFAEGTTLGGDDGIAVAMILAVLSDDSIAHPPLIAVLTTDEETGMTGAANIDLSDVKSKILINIDSEEEGVLTVGCAGGAKCKSEFQLVYENCTDNTFELKIHGLVGGHSGVEINKGRLNADITMAELLKYIKSRQSLKLCSINGGSKDNAIPSECSAVIEINADNDTVLSICRDFKKSIVTCGDDSLEINVEKISCEKGFDIQTTERILGFLTNIPNGVIKMCKELPELVQTSLNLGVIECKENTLYTVISVRSSVNGEKDELVQRLEKITHDYGGRITVSGQYPAWEYRKKSRLRECMIDVYETMFSRKPNVETIHAGLECGLFCGKIKNLDAVSFGPNILDIHTPKERLDIKSTKRTYNYLLEVLKEL